ncbi:hypothetical protein Q7C36_004564 [Tachysurus vachellii]|uniref:Death domain-containing protein 1 n=1 Tax=Tachysurus vachellii TaxID=175792 RepID=A0AA88NMP9_TACVA|nr:hypothetical protein Q7C36_004564 [Tachysurus vachellii]
MLGANLHFGSCPEDKILNMLQATIQRLQELLHLERTSSTEAHGSEFTEASGHPLGNGDLARALRKVLHLFKEWSVLYTYRVGCLREALNSTVRTLMERDRNANHGHTVPKRETHAKQLGASREGHFCKLVYVNNLILSVLGDVHSIEKTLLSITSKVDSATTIVSRANLQSTEAEITRDDLMIRDLLIRELMMHSKDRLVLPRIFDKEQCGPPNTDPEHTSNVSPLIDIQKCVLQSNQEQTHAALERKTSHNELFNESTIDLETRGEDNILCEMLKSSRIVGHSPLGEDAREVKNELLTVDERDKKAEKISIVVMDEHINCAHSWNTVGLTDSARSSSKVLCYITAPIEVTKVIRCKAVDSLSSLMVSGSEELVSSVLRLENISNMKCPFPITVAVPFQSLYHQNYRETVVKVVDQQQRISYVTPAATDGFYGGCKGTFAVVKVYTLGVFAVLSRLQRQTFTIPKRGLCLKLSVDSRICLDYPPGSFSTPVVAQAMVQPVDAMLLSSLKYRNDSCHPILTTSPLLYLNHPLTVSPLCPLTLTLPCPLKPKTMTTREQNSHSTALIPDNTSSHQVRLLSAPVKASKKLTKEQLVVLGWKDKHWNVLDTVTVRNMQKDLVSFEVLENYERLIVLRLLSSVRPSCLVLFAEELQESVRTCTVSIVMHKRQKDPGSVVLAVLPSRDLSWGLAELHAQAYYGSPEQSSEMMMREGEQLLIKFSGNITSTGDQCTEPHTLTFHNQRKNWLCLQLKELNPYGNYNSPYYKGMALIFQIPKDQLVWREDKAVISEDYCLGQPVCKLTLTLPKNVETLSRPIGAKFLQQDQAESLCDELLAWLCSELSEEDAAMLVVCLRLRRSSVQLARLRAPNSLALQNFHILTTWRQALPSLTPKRPLLAHCLTRIGRPELAAELLKKGLAVDMSET